MAHRIVFDARRVRDFGVGTYIRNLVRALASLDHTNQYTLVQAPAPVPEFASLPPNFQTVTYEKTNGGILSQFRLSMFLKRLAADVYHVPLNIVPAAMPRPYIVTVHDVGNLIFETGRGWRESLGLFRLRQGLLRADRVIAVSSATRRDLEHFVAIPSARIRTIYNAPDPAFFEHRSSPIPCLEENGLKYAPGIQRILDRYQINYPFLLYAGRTNPRKNIPRLVEAFAVARGELQENDYYRNLRLIIIGDEISKNPALRHAVIQSRVEHSVRFLGFVPLETLRVFYQAAAAFVFPSLYEGFGLPPLEAMACGTPVVTTHVSSLPEVVGDAAVIVNPENVFDIARGIREVLLDRRLRQSVIEKGFQKALQFSWHEAAVKVLETYEEICRGGGGAAASV
ncbi:MAG TPA: glycosyltransferase family 1 protein [Bryobacteraceae bacterium]|nr:glycosyltransferase family 1 protein [Bryobacteraceae bacterium]